MTEEIVYYSDRENAYRSVRFCLSDEVLLEVAKEMEADFGMDISELSKLALEEFMCDRGYLKIE